MLFQSSYARRPFVIGLTGGTASGKSSIGKRLAKLGAGIVDCDALGESLLCDYSVFSFSFNLGNDFFYCETLLSC